MNPDDALFPHSTSLKQVVEALVFASPKPITIKEIVAALKAAGDKDKTDDAVALEFAKAKEADVAAALAEISSDLISTQRAFRLVEQINGWALVTDPSAVHWVRQLYPEAKPTRLTSAQLETLAIIAYRQPVTRADMEAVRGVAVDSVVQVLTERSLIKIAGRAEVPGRPLLYETTQYFLQHFGIKTVDELPNAQELKRVELPKAPVPEAAPEEAAAEKPKKGKKGKDAEAAAAEAPAAEAASSDAPAAEVAGEGSETPAAETAAESETAAQPETESETEVVEISEDVAVAEEAPEVPESSEAPEPSEAPESSEAPEPEDHFESSDESEPPEDISPEPVEAAPAEPAHEPSEGVSQHSPEEPS